MNIWRIVDNQCPIPNNITLGNVDCLKYIWKNKSWLGKSDDVLQKVITILQAIWIPRNNIVFKSDKCNSYFVLELLRKLLTKPELIQTILIFLVHKKLQI